MPEVTKPVLVVGASGFVGRISSGGYSRRAGRSAVWLAMSPRFTTWPTPAVRLSG